MNRLLIASILALLSWGVSAQTWAMTDQTFERAYGEHWVTLACCWLTNS